MAHREAKRPTHRIEVRAESQATGAVRQGRVSLTTVSSAYRLGLDVVRSRRYRLRVAAIEAEIV